MNGLIIFIKTMEENPPVFVSLLGRPNTGPNTRYNTNLSRPSTDRSDHDMFLFCTRDTYPSLVV